MEKVYPQDLGGMVPQKEEQVQVQPHLVGEVAPKEGVQGSPPNGGSGPPKGGASVLQQEGAQGLEQDNHDDEEVTTSCGEKHDVFYGFEMYNEPLFFQGMEEEDASDVILLVNGGVEKGAGVDSVSLEKGDKVIKKAVDKVGTVQKEQSTKGTVLNVSQPVYVALSD